MSDLFPSRPRCTCTCPSGLRSAAMRIPLPLPSGMKSVTLRPAVTNSNNGAPARQFQGKRFSPVSLLTHAMFSSIFCRVESTVEYIRIPPGFSAATPPSQSFAAFRCTALHSEQTIPSLQPGNGTSLRLNRGYPQQSGQRTRVAARSAKDQHWSQLHCPSPTL
jgi:hypothetical protein